MQLQFFATRYKSNQEVSLDNSVLVKVKTQTDYQLEITNDKNVSPNEPTLLKDGVPNDIFYQTPVP